LADGGAASVAAEASPMPRRSLIMACPFGV
jgi:hypothetical protein